MDVQTKELTMFKLMCIVFSGLLMTGCAINDIGNTVNRKMDNYSIIDTIKEPQSKMDYIRFESVKRKLQTPISQCRVVFSGMMIM